MGTAFRASGYIEFTDEFVSKVSEVIYIITKKYGMSNIEIERLPNDRSTVKIDLFGNNGIDYEPLKLILKKYKKHISSPVVISEWVESYGGLYFDPQEEE